MLKLKIQNRSNPPNIYNKETIKQAMSVKREEIINQNKDWIIRNIDNPKKKFQLVGMMF